MATGLGCREIGTRGLVGPGRRLSACGVCEGLVPWGGRKPIFQCPMKRIRSGPDTGWDGWPAVLTDVGRGPSFWDRPERGVGGELYCLALDSGASSASLGLLKTRTLEVPGEWIGQSREGGQDADGFNDCQLVLRRSRCLQRLWQQTSLGPHLRSGFRLGPENARHRPQVAPCGRSGEHALRAAGRGSGTRLSF